MASSSSTHNFAVPLAKDSMASPGSATSRTSEMSLSPGASDHYMATSPNNHHSPFTPPSTLHRSHPFFKEPMAMSSSASSAVSSSALLMSNQLPFALNEEDEDDEENEDELYRNFMDDDPKPPMPTQSMEAGEVPPYGPYGQSPFGTGIQHQMDSTMANSFLAKSYPPPSMFPPMHNHHGNDPLSASLAQSSKHLSNFDTTVSSFEMPTSSSSRIHVCYWIDCYKQFSSQSQLVLHIEYCHIDQQRYCQDNYTCFWINCPRQSRPFNARYKLLNHMRIHSGEKPNKCPVREIYKMWQYFYYS